MRTDIAAQIYARLSASQARLAEAYRASGPIAHFVVDELLPFDLAARIAERFPVGKQMHFKRSVRERKYISSQLDRYDPLIQEVTFAFHDPRIISVVEHITGHMPLHADPLLYASGISRMEVGGFLNPHIDNSHNKDRTRWRALNLLYYVSPGWTAHWGGNLELWPHGVKDAPITIPSLYNRLVVMATHHHSLHSVSPVHASGARNCISNYFFSEKPMHPEQSFHVTAFRGRPEQPCRDLLLRADAALRMGLRRLKPSGFFKTGHWYAAPPQ